MTTHYIKRGRRYIPISEYDADLRDSLPSAADIADALERSILERT